jgi:hypothetical protein
MPLIVAGLETDLLVLLGPYLVRVGLDGITADGSNPSLRIPIRRAARRLGVTVAGDAVTDEELATFDGDPEVFSDLAELKALEIIWGHWPKVDMQAGEESQSLSQLADRIQKRIADLKASLGTIAISEPAASELVPGQSSAALIRAGLPYPPSPVPDRYSRPTFWYGGKYYS